MGAEARGEEVFFPMRDVAGAITGYRRRKGDNGQYEMRDSKTGEANNTKAITTKGAKGGILGPWPLAEGGAAVLLVEVEMDCAAALAAGARAVLGTAGSKPGKKAEEWLQQILAGRKVILAPDPDEAGEGWRDRLGRILRAVSCDVAYIAPLPGMDLDKRLKSAADARAELARLASLAVPWEAREARGGAGGAEVLVGPDEARVCDEVLAVLQQKVKNMFQRAGDLVTVRGARSDQYMRRFGGLAIVGIKAAWVRDKASRHTKLMRRVEGEKKQIHTPDWIGSIIVSRTEWPSIPELVGVANYPVLTRSGVRRESGYDADSGWLITPDVIPKNLSDHPSAEQLVEAKALLHEVVEDFPFSNEAGESAWLAYVLTILARTAFDGPSPLILADASVRGSGKTMLISIGGMIATGAPPAVTPETVGDADEVKKQIISILAGGDPVALFDNLTKIGGSAIDALLTSSTYKDRILGKSEMKTLPNLTVWTATGNNPITNGDVRRRILPIRLEPSVERPEERVGFRHANLEAWVTERREDLLCAALTLLAGWHAAGRPDQGLTPWGSYVGWSDVVRNALVWAGYPDPALCREEFLVVSDPDETQLGALMELLVKYRNPITGKEIIAKITSEEFKGDAAETVREIAMGHGGMSARTLGKRLERWRGRVGGGWRLESRAGAGGVMRYRAVPIDGKYITASVTDLRDKNSGFSGDSGFVSTVTGMREIDKGGKQNNYNHQTHYEALAEARELRDVLLAARGIVLKLSDTGGLVVLGLLADCELEDIRRLDGAIKALLVMERDREPDMLF
jgi:5S rRNA maturation endonuclease (ribonuclease M5)